MSPATFEAAIQAPMHPALKWTPWGGNDPGKHRRMPEGDTACGLPGPLILAEDDHELCPDCYPSQTKTSQPAT